MFKKVLIFSLFTFLILGAGTGILRKYNWDITQNRANSLTDASKRLLAQLDSELNINVFSPNIDYLNLLNELLRPYQQQSPYIKLVLHQTTVDPQRGNELKVYTEHNLSVEYKGLVRAIDISTIDISENKISTLIQQTINQTEQWLVFLTGHQELDPLDQSEFGISNFAQTFKAQGMQIAKLNLAEQKVIPENTNVLIIANPQQDFLALEKALLKQYIAKGGNLLWFTEPGSTVTALLTEEFGLRLAPGVAVDPGSMQLGSPHPAVKILTKLPANSITKGIDGAILLPWSGHLEFKFMPHKWHQQHVLSTSKTTWTYNGELTTNLNILAANKIQQGPLNIALAFTRQLDAEQEQHALVVADSSFIMNKYLNIYANARLVTNMLDWVQNDVEYFVFSPNTLKDISYHPSKFDVWIYKYFFTLVLPLLFVSMGWVLHRR